MFGVSSRSQCSGRWRVHGVSRRFTQQDPPRFFSGLGAQLGVALDTIKRRVGREQNVRVVSQAVIFEWLAFDNVEAGECDMTRVERFQECPFVDKRAAGRIDEHRPRSHRGQGPCIDQVPGRRIQITMEADKMALLEQFLELEHAADPERLVHTLAEKWVVKDNVEPERLSTEGRRRADPTAADNAERLAPEPGSTRRRPVVPRPCADRRMRGDQSRTIASRNIIAWSATSSVP